MTDTPVAQMDGMLYKDENNRLAVGTNLFVLLVDHYTASSQYPGFYRFVGNKVEVVVGHISVAKFFLMISEEYYQKGMQLVKANIHEFYKIIEVRHPKSTSIACGVLKFLTLGWVDLLRHIPKDVSLLKDHRYATGRVLPDISILINEAAFDRIIRIKDVKDTYIDIAKIWQETIAVTPSGPADITEPLQSRQAVLLFESGAQEPRHRPL